MTLNPELDNRLKNIESMLKQVLNQNSEEVDLEEAASLVRLTTGTLRNYIDKGKFKIPSTKRGKKLYFKRSDVVKWDKDREFHSR
jgi:excisionase family DNA binding protein